MKTPQFLTPEYVAIVKDTCERAEAQVGRDDLVLFWETVAKLQEEAGHVAIAESTRYTAPAMILEETMEDLEEEGPLCFVPGGRA